MTKRALKIGFGIAFLVAGLFVTIGGIALTALVGADGRFEMPESTARSEGHALIFDAIYIRGDLPVGGSLAATVGVEIRGREGQDVFVGVAPIARVHRYLADVPYDRVVRIDWPGGADTEPFFGSGELAEPPGSQSWWVASDEGPTASIDWTVQGGDWSVVIMNADGSADVDVAGRVEVDVPILGPVSIGTLIVGLVLLVLGVWTTISGSKTPVSSRVVAAPPPPPPLAEGASPPRPDA